jgi:signal peptidase I
MSPRKLKSPARHEVKGPEGPMMVQTGKSDRRNKADASRPGTESHAGLRQYLDELVFVFVIVMFMKMFLVELYKIPSGSMTPTLLGGMVAHVDFNEDQEKDIIYLEQPREIPYVFSRTPDRYVYDADLKPVPAQLKFLRSQGKLENQFDRILVNKLAYWFRNPERGEIVIFKVPARIHTARAPIYIKRCVGESGDLLTFDPAGHLMVNGETLRDPVFFQAQEYVTRVNRHTKGFFQRPEIEYEKIDSTGYRLKEIRIPGNESYVFGDNMHGSLDSRYWGGVSLNQFKGRAFMRVWPLNQFNFLH